MTRGLESGHNPKKLCVNLLTICARFVPRASLSVTVTLTAESLELWLHQQSPTSANMRAGASTMLLMLTGMACCLGYAAAAGQVIETQFAYIVYN